MTNKEAVKQLESAYSDDIFRHGEYEACKLAIQALKENDKLKADIDLLSSINNSLVKQNDKLKERIKELEFANRLATGLVDDFDKSNKEISDKWMGLNDENIKLKAEIEQLEFATGLINNLENGNKEISDKWMRRIANLQKIRQEYSKMNL